MQQHEYGDFGIEATSPEISKKDKTTLATVCKLGIETLEIIRQQGLHTEVSLALAEAKLIKEYLEVDIEPRSEEELTTPEESEAGNVETTTGQPEDENVEKSVLEPGFVKK